MIAPLHRQPPPGSPAWVTPEIFQLAHEVYQPRYDYPLTDTQLLAIVIHWDRLLKWLRKSA